MTGFGKFAAVGIALAVGAAAGSGSPAEDPALVDPQTPTKHFRFSNPARVDEEDVERIYQRIRKTMIAGYALSRIPDARSYAGWQRYNRAPYLSARHGARYVNNYANSKARAYGRFESMGELPCGAVLAKDSFAVTDDGRIFPGPLFLMEKMPGNFGAQNGWRYTMIMPDGSLFGRSQGEGSKQVQFCAACHNAAPTNQLFLVPKKYRATSLPSAPGPSE